MVTIRDKGHTRDRTLTGGFWGSRGWGERWILPVFPGKDLNRGISVLPSLPPAAPAPFLCVIVGPAVPFLWAVTPPGGFILPGKEPGWARGSGGSGGLRGDPGGSGGIRGPGRDGGRAPTSGWACPGPGGPRFPGRWDIVVLPGVPGLGSWSWGSGGSGRGMLRAWGVPGSWREASDPCGSTLSRSEGDPGPLGRTLPSPPSVSGSP